MANFNDNFSKQSDSYVKFRPGYPPELFAYLQTVAPGNDLAWDCGTGNGQSAIRLADHFTKVIATDPSAEQVKNAIPHDRVTYRVEKAESSGLEDRSADLITVAQAIHWFDFDAFYAEVKRVLKDKGVLAAWAYGLPEISPEVNEVIRHFHDVTIGDFWQPQNRLIENGYATIPFPFEQLSPPDFYIRKEASLPEVLGLTRSWSATQRYIDANGVNPVEELEPRLKEVWKDADRKELTWKLILKVGRNN
jgi:SAM-dependent methyltransferase